MKAVFYKELNTFFASAIGYLVIGVFLVLNGLFLWVFDGDFNILNAGFADLNGFFFLAPWVFLFLIPAITMRMFADEYQNGTIELLKTRPIGILQIVNAKFLAAFCLVILALIPTLIYIYTIHILGNPVGNFDLGSMLGSYIGLLFMVSSYTAIGLFSSTLASNQIVAFIISISISFCLFYGFEAAASLFGSNSYTVQQLGMNEHYKSLSRGVIDTSNLIYFSSITTLFLVFTKWQLELEK
ncbi:gliding motility-associated ABC transporter permease subunit GldF [Urechidicola sp. KH5]